MRARPAALLAIVLGVTVAASAAVLAASARPTPTTRASSPDDAVAPAAAELVQPQTALAAGEAPSWVAAMLGHASPEMLFSVYARFIG